ncbi:MAG: DNA mismatch repair endonuclease MutL [Dehalococcoidia bacterium]|nr:DNA mismatch repair endonuclease MutL [Dehalococcoidia bacterium]MDD5494550.1 DNA mismatch repair endonuclease MutL [Dehalococcoidia bacterium]
MSIQVLSPEVTSKIAAGEVVDRPASVVKELLENSLDAGATQITVEAQNGGVSLIRVTDNGSGLDDGEAEIAFLRHATSKITGLDDLEHINTLGFRGEALPSIASVAEVEMLTSNSASAATYLRLENGEITVREKRSRPQGTTVTVRHLFRNFPARLKFLKSANTESGHIANVVSQYALAFPDVKFNLQVEGRVNLRTSGDGDLRSTVSELYGLETAQKMLNVESGDDLVKLSGLTSPPSVQRSSRSYLSFFVNRRYVRNSLLARAVDTAYQGLLMTGRHPVVILNIAIPPEEVDVNVHPTKIEVKFRNNNVVFTAVEKALRQTLEKAPLPNIQIGSGDDGQALSLWERAAAATAALPVLRTLGQLSASYILAEGPEGLYLIDQHAAHERILFDRLTAQKAASKPEIQGMLEPLAIELTPTQEQAYRNSGQLLQEFGFDIEPFGERTCLVRTVPAMINTANLMDTLKELLDTLGSEQDRAQQEQKAMQTLACHGAVRAGDVLEMEEMRHLIIQLERTSQPRTCPHGRPTMIHLSAQQLRREFGRAG